MERETEGSVGNSPNGKQLVDERKQMSKLTITEMLVKTGILAVIRTDRSDNLLRIVQSLLDGGLDCIEISMTTPSALQAIERVAVEGKNVVIGAGTVLDESTARAAILSGAEFLVTPTVERDVIETAHRYGKVVIGGAMTPTEILRTWEVGADLVKIFPASTLGPGYLEAIHGPLPQVPLVPVGGITAQNAGEFIRAGAAAICAGGWLTSQKAIAEGRYDLLATRAQELVRAVREAR